MTMKSKSTDDDDLVSIPAAAAAIGIDRSTLSRHVALRKVRSHAGKVRVSEVLARSRVKFRSGLQEAGAESGYRDGRFHGRCDEP